MLVSQSVLQIEKNTQKNPVSKGKAAFAHSKYSSWLLWNIIFRILKIEKYKEKLLAIEFLGLTGSTMTNTASRWEIRSFRKKCISITTDSKSTECSASLILKTSSHTTHTTPNIPIGINEWTFPADGYERTPRMLNFHKYVAQPGNYCCNDGTCFTSELACDGIRHCQSGEDEVNCTMIDIPEYYDKMDPSLSCVTLAAATRGRVTSAACQLSH